MQAFRGPQVRAVGRRTFVGRDRELAGFRAALAGEPGAYTVLFLHGVGGVGKSTLLRQFAATASAAGRSVIEVDCGRITGSVAEFEEEAAAAVTADAPVLLVDTFERCRNLEGWLREHFLPQLPAGAVVVIAGRHPCDPLWAADEAWVGLLRIAALGELARPDATDLLRRRGVPEEHQEAVLRFAGGHPFALSLAATVPGEALGHRSGVASTVDVVTALLRQLIGDVPSARHQRALEVCAHAWRTTEDLLRVFVGSAAAETFAWLHAQPFVESSGDGLFPHDVVRGVLDADLRWRDPDGYLATRDRLIDHQLERIQAASGRALRSAARAVYHLVREGEILPDIGVPDDAEGYHAGPVRDEDVPAMRRILAEVHNEESVAILDFWMQRDPTGFEVYRRVSDGAVRGFSLFLWLEENDAGAAAADPVVAAAFEHAGRAPSRPGEQILVARLLVPTARRLPFQITHLMRVRMTEAYLHSPRLSWSFFVTTDDAVAMTMELLSHRKMPTRPRIGARSFNVYAHDWRAMPKRQWLRKVATWTYFGRPAAEDAATPTVDVLSRSEFDAEVRAALRGLRRTHTHLGGRLLRTRMVLDRCDARRSPAEVLARLLTDAIDTLGGDPREAKVHRALVTTYLEGLTQEAGADRLDTPLVTYRRQVSRGTAQVVELLWRKELSSLG
ncbi:hypothetical protein Val02_51040 [Virgisporangium aliadipatigenens]|uniref:Orc1-like AAA ATPase domain-containing protein n=1 Tax=Virgisporangium aliadipatigenens TaxID=741659 RepID=A0A8J3YR23_9ACTN|nr:AAA family ATPase [Virgisporangium aliadipatigenens]GIJ48218.1 hypothetical protein Val02_51040 [Virgisporangium aliadipatigenens]